MTAMPGYGYPPPPRPATCRAEAPATAGAMRAAEDRELAERSSVDAEAFGVLYARYSRQIYRMIYRRLGNSEDAEDITAEVFVKALKAIDGYHPARAPFWGWLYRIARNAMIDHVRARRPAVSLAAVEDPSDPAADVESQVIRHDEAARAWQAVETLCATQRTAVTLRLAHDLPIAAIAEQMDRSEGAVKQLINRGLTVVRHQLLTDQLTDQLDDAAAAGSSRA
jgi:RNA polymerase sigma-70 factor (ECF subfamily)